MKRSRVFATIAALSALFAGFAALTVPTVAVFAFAPARSGQETGAQAGPQNATALPADINPVTLTEAQLALGKQQVERMLRDRPEMAVYVHSGDPLYTWVVRQVAGGAIGDLILWSDDIGNYPAEYTACHQPPSGSAKGVIMMRRLFAAGSQKGKPIPADILWSNFVFELFNISNTRYMLANNQAALDGKIGRQEFITEGARNEFKAIGKTAAFYRQYWRPLTVRRHLRVDASSWDADEPATFDAWIGQYTDPTQYPNSYWGMYYDQSVIPYRKAMEEYRKQLGQQK